MATTTTYLIPGKEYSGSDIISAQKGKFIKINDGGNKKLVKRSMIKINTNGVYKLVYIPENNTCKLYPVNGWSCSKETYDNIMKDGKRIVDEIFGDLIDIEVDQLKMKKKGK